VNQCSKADVESAAPMSVSGRKSAAQELKKTFHRSIYRLIIGRRQNVE
jgi:hypothetical protein